jgi:hypothetical protein
MVMLKRVSALVFLAAACVAPAFGATSPRDGLAQARARLDGLSSYHVSVDDGTGPVEIDYAPPQRIRVTAPGSIAIIVDGSSYLKVGNNDWVPSGVNTTLGVLLITLAEDLLITAKDADTVTDRGTVLLAGTVLRMYEISTPINGSFLRRTVWVGEKDGLPHRVERSGGITTLTADYPVILRKSVLCGIWPGSIAFCEEMV